MKSEQVTELQREEGRRGGIRKASRKRRNIIFKSNFGGKSEILFRLILATELK